MRLTRARRATARLDRVEGGGIDGVRARAADSRPHPAAFPRAHVITEEEKRELAAAKRDIALVPEGAAREALREARNRISASIRLHDVPCRPPVPSLFAIYMKYSPVLLKLE